MKIIFTRHAEERLKKRRILKVEVIETLRFSDRAIKKFGLYYLQKRLFRGTIEVCCERTGKSINIITAYWLVK